MATIIKSISFHNFYNYYGEYERNTYCFTEGLNFINADNNGGKTKFFCGLLWMFMDHTYDQDSKTREPVSSSQFIKMLSRKADREHEGEQVTMGVKLVFEDEHQVQYSLCKQVEFGADRNHQKVTFQGKKKSKDSIVSILESEVERRKALELLIPSALNNYALLQGEYMDKLLDVTSSKKFADTIRSLSGIHEIEALKTNASTWHKNAENILKEKEQVAAETNENVKHLIEMQSQLRANIEELENRIAEYKTKKAEASDTKDNLEAFMSSAKVRSDLRNKHEEVEKKLKEKRDDLKNFDSFIASKTFSNYNPWAFFGLSHEKDEFQTMRDQHFMNVKTAQGLGGILLPVDSPDTPSLRRMLQTKICEVCGRSFEDHSSEWEHIDKLIHRGEEKQTTKNDFLGFIDQIRSSVEGSGTNEHDIIDGINEAKQDYLALIKEIRILKEEKEQILDQFQNVGGNIDDLQAKDSDTANLKEYASALKTISDCDNYINANKPNLDRWKNDYENLQKAIAQSPVASDTKPYRDFESQTKAILDILIEARENIYNDIINSIESASNNYFSLLTKNNAVGGGKIKISKLDDKNIQVTVKSIDEKDEMTGLGTGFQRMKQLAILMAIIQTQIGGTKYDAPLIADAPFSGFSRNFTNNFIEETPRVFVQEIILTKDTVNTLESGEVILNELGEDIKNNVVNGVIKGTFYMNQPTNVDDQTKLETYIKQFN